MRAALETLRPGLRFLAPGEPGEGCVIRDDGAGPVIELWTDPRTQPTQAEIEAAVLPAAKAKRIAAINAECRARLIARFGPAEEQVSRSVGVYGAAEQSALSAGIAATIDASNTAQNAILAAADIAAVEAVAVTWPAI